MSEPRSIWSAIQTFLIVTLITVMVWLLAESRMVRTRSIEAQLILTTIDTPGSMALVVRQSQTGKTPVRIANIQIEGSTAGFDRFARLLQNRVELRVGREVPGEPGEHELDLQLILQEQIFAMGVHGLVVTEVTPPTIRVEVDEIETREFPIRVMLPNGLDLDGVPRADPVSVRVNAPASVLAKVTSDEAIVRIHEDIVSQLDQGRLETVPGAVVTINGLDEDSWASQIEPSQVDVRLTLRTQIEQMTVDRLPVQVLLAPGEIGKWGVEINDSDKDLVNVMVAGPIESIRLLRSGEVKLRAFVMLSFEDLGRGVSAKPAQVLGLPPGCRVVSPEISVNLKITRLGSTPAGQPNGQPAIQPNIQPGTQPNPDPETGSATP